jgi:hypothetical protein
VRGDVCTGQALVGLVAPDLMAVLAAFGHCLAVTIVPPPWRRRQRSAWRAAAAARPHAHTVALA